jgi:hypothetical protein
MLSRSGAGGVIPLGADGNGDGEMPLQLTRRRRCDTAGKMYDGRETVMRICVKLVLGGVMPSTRWVAATATTRCM